MNLHSQFIAEHVALRKGIAEIQKAAAEGARKLNDVFPSFRERLSKHIHLEDSIYYRFVEEGKLLQDRELMHALRNDHAGTVFTLESLSIRLHKGGPLEDWKKRFNAMIHVLLEHFELEEDKLFPAVEQLLSPEQKASLQEALKKAGE